MRVVETRVDEPGRASAPLRPVTLAGFEIGVTLIYLVPRTSFLGAILMTGYLGGAVLTHLRVGDPWFFPVIIGVLAWIGLALRQPMIFSFVMNGAATARSDT